MNKTQTISKTWMLSALVTLCVLVLTVSRVAANPAQSAQTTAQPAAETYMWYGELTAFDESARKMTVKTRVVGDQALSGLKGFKSGDRIAMTWSGIDKYADGILSVARHDAGKKYDERFTFPVEFVSFDATTQYVTFKTDAPADGVATLKSLKPGEWIAATSRHKPARENEAIVSVVPYVDSWKKTS